MRLFILTLLLVNFHLRAQPSFYESFPVFTSDGLTGNILTTNDGGYAFLRCDYGPSLAPNLKLIKTDVNGSVQWVSTTASNTMSAADGLTPRYVYQTMDSGYVVTAINNTSGNSEIVLLKFNAIGTLLWNRTIDDQNSSLYDYRRSIVETANGDCIMIATESFTNSSTLSLVNVSSFGTISWFRRFVISGKNTSGYTISKTNDGGFFITGSVSNPSANPICIKTDQNFNITWANSFGLISSYNIATSTSEGEYILACNTASATNLLKLKSNGSLEWNKSYARGSANSSDFITETADKGFVTCGYTNGPGTAPIKGFIFKADSLGNPSFYKIMTDTSDMHGVQRTPDNGFIFSGCKIKNGTTDEPLIIKTDPDGNALCGMTDQTVAITSPTISVDSHVVTDVLNPPYTSGTLSLTNTVSTNITGIIYCTDVGITSYSNDLKFDIFPNPANDILNINSNGSTSDLEITIINIYGNIVSKHNILSNQQKQLNISHLSCDIYLVEINSNDFSIKRKLLKID